MKEIILRGGLCTKVDDEDFDYLLQWKWNAYVRPWTTYVSGGEHRFMHRQLFPDSKMVDHIDGDGLNNQKYNLRKCTHIDNIKNRKGWGVSKYKGVSLGKDGKKWRAQIYLNSKVTNLGHFKTEIEAAEAYNKAATGTGNPFYKINVIP